MTAQQIITQHLDIWTAAHKTRSGVGRGSSNKLDLYGIKKLRELILELAVRGKLVPQDPNDEPASELLKKIAAEKAQLIKEGKIKKEKPLPEITDDEKPFHLPIGWEWARFGELYELEYGDNLPEPKRSGTGEFSVFGSNGIVGTHNECCIKSPCIVVGRKGSAGALNLCLDSGCWVTDVAYSVVPPSNLDLNFVFKQFHTLGLDVLGKGIKPGLNRNEAYILLVAIPPLAEQHRIVAKVDELMAFCDQLEQTQSDNIAAHAQLVEALLATLTNSRDHKELQTNWQRIAAHFDTLFTTEHSIDQLKQTILQLAVMGKLVPQNTNDEPASVLLKKITAEKAQLIKEGKIKKEKPLPEITDEEKPFELPSGWEWVRFGKLFESFTNGLYKSESFYSDDGYISLRMYNIQDGKIDFSGVRRVHVTPEELEQYQLAEGDLLINRVNSKELVGKTALIPKADEPLVYESMNMRARPVNLVFSSYLNLFMMCNTAKSALLFHAKEAVSQASINQSQISSLLTSLPPLAEQHRIVTKVDELMSLCGTLKTNLQNAQATQLALADALVEQAVL